MRGAVVGVVFVLASSCAAGEPDRASPSSVAERPGARSPAAESKTSTLRSATDIPNPGSGGVDAPKTSPPGETLAAMPQAGTYRYRTSGSRTFGSAASEPMPEITTLTIGEIATSGRSLVRDLRTTEGNGSVSESIMRYASQGTYLEIMRVTTYQEGFVDRQTFVPTGGPALVDRPGSKPGDRLEFDLNGGGTTIHIVVEMLGREEIEIGGSPVSTVALRIESTFKGSLSGHGVTESWIAPLLGFPVKEHATLDVEVSLIRNHSECRYELKELPR